MLKIPKTTVYNVFKRYDLRESTENAKKSGIGKPHCLTLQTDLTILKILMCVKKQCGGLFESRGIVGAYTGRKYEFRR